MYPENEQHDQTIPVQPPIYTGNHYPENPGFTTTTEDGVYHYFIIIDGNYKFYSLVRRCMQFLTHCQYYKNNIFNAMFYEKGIRLFYDQLVAIVLLGFAKLIATTNE